MVLPCGQPSTVSFHWGCVQMCRHPHVIYKGVTINQSRCNNQRITSINQTVDTRTWNTTSSRAACCRCGMTWIALAPVPTTATFLPASWMLLSHAAVCRVGPWNADRPGTAGMVGMDRGPVAGAAAAVARGSGRQGAGRGRVSTAQPGLAENGTGVVQRQQRK